MTRTLAALLAAASLSACATLTSPPAAQTSAPPETDPVPPSALTAAPSAEPDSQIVDEPAAAPEPVTVAAAPPPPATLMDEIRGGFQLAHATDEKRVQQHLAWLERHPTYLERLRPRVERYLAGICDDVRKRQLPTELCLLPIIESALDPLAFSPGGAAGLWQFIPATGKRYGLKIDWWVDERRDPIAATDAALDYLQALHERFGDWTLAVAAYNCGEGRVARAVRRAGPDADFFDLKLPRETAAYVPRLLAFAAIAADPNGYEVALPFEGIPADAVATASVETGGQIDVARAADAVGLTVDELYALNPALNQWATHPDGPHRLIVPADRADAAQAALTAIPEDQRVAWSRHRIRPNQTLGGIALAYDTDVATLKRINQLSSSRIRAGDHLLIPTSSLAAEDYPTPARTRAASGGAVHVVQAGESLWTIARDYDVSTRTLMRLNHVGPKDYLQIGQKIIVPQGDTDASGARSRSATVRTVTYRVRSGDSLGAIAAKFNVSVNKIAGWNGIARDALIHPGQALVLHVDVTASRT